MSQSKHADPKHIEPEGKPKRAVVFDGTQLIVVLAMGVFIAVLLVWPEVRLRGMVPWGVMVSASLGMAFALWREHAILLKMQKKEAVETQEVSLEKEKRISASLKKNMRELEDFQTELTCIAQELFAVNQLAQSVLKAEDEDLLSVALAVDLADEFDGVVTRIWRSDASHLEMSSEAGVPIACRLLQLSEERLQKIQGEGAKRWVGAELSQLMGHEGQDLGVKSCVSLPVFKGKSKCGVLELWSRQELKESSVESLELLANIVGVGLARLKMEQSLEDEVFARTEELLAAMDEAERANRLKSEFLANISHELRTPLHGVLSFARFGIKKINKAKPEKLLGYFTQIESSGELLLRLVNDLLDLSKLDAGKMEMFKEETSLKALVSGVVDELSALLMEKELKVTIVSDDDVPNLSVDRKRIAQIIRNLLSNALKFSPVKSEIRCVISMVNSFRSVRLSIEDEGLGIPSDELGLVFEKFSQSSATKTGAGGTGLGLPICRELAEAHHGRLWAENRKEGGAVFHVELPVAQNQDQETKKQATEIAAPIQVA